MPPGSWRSMTDEQAVAAMMAKLRGEPLGWVRYTLDGVRHKIPVVGDTTIVVPRTAVGATYIWDAHTIGRHGRPWAGWPIVVGVTDLYYQPKGQGEEVTGTSRVRFLYE